MRFLLLFLTLCLSIPSFAQPDDTDNAQQTNPYDAEITTFINQYAKDMFDGKYIEIVDKAYPKLFTIAPKEAIVAQFKDLFESEDVKIAFTEFEVTNITDTVQTEEELFAFIDYKMAMTINVKDLEDPTTLLSIYKGQYGEDNVSYDEKTKDYTIRTENQMFAIKKEDKWYVLENKQEYGAFLGMMIDESIVERLNAKL